MDVALIDGLFVRAAGPTDARMLVMIHAFADSGTAFVPLFDTPLAERFRLLAVDLAGFGASPPQADVRTVAEHADRIAALILSLSPTGPVGLVGHSVASMIAVDAAARLGKRFGGLFSIEGNLTADDTYFSGRAAQFEDASAFKRCFLDDVWAMAQTQPVLRRYVAAAVAADPIAMWQLGRDAQRLSIGDGPGEAYRRVRPSLYYWSAASTPEATQRWLARSDIPQRRFADASHWPTVDQPAATAQAMAAFYDGV